MMHSRQFITLLLSLLLAVLAHCATHRPDKAQSSLANGSLVGALREPSVGDFDKMMKLLGPEGRSKQKSQKSQLLKTLSRRTRSPQGDRANALPDRYPEKPRPGFLWTIAKATYDTFNDTRSAIQQIGQIVSDNFAPDPPPPGAKSSRPKLPTTTPAGPKSSTEEPEFKLTRAEFRNLLLRNIKGLVRLFKIEWSDAVQQSGRNFRDFRRELGNQIGSYLRNNPKNYGGV